MATMLVRVRCVDDGRELLVEGRRLEWRVQVDTIKRLVLEQRRRSRVSEHVQESDEEEALSRSFLFFQGKILADSDMINLFSLTPTDFFVFVQEPESSEDAVGSPTEVLTPRKHCADPELRRQLLEMGFASDQVDRALRYGETELDQAVERIMRGDSEDTSAVQSPCSGRLEVTAVDSQVQELQHKALTDPFDAVMLLKERFSSDALASLIENPASTVRTLRQAAARPVVHPSIGIHDASRSHSHPDAPTAEQEFKANSDVAVDSNSPIERLVAMGFARDLVVAMYESCGFDEHLTANALLQTLET